MRIKKFKNLVFTLGSILIATAAHADRGGWVSSGGEIFLFDRNPWFVKNIKTVSYCLQVDAATVSAAPDTVGTAFRAALDYWRKEFQASRLPLTPGLVQLADQDFREAPCSPSVDLMVKVGYGTLDADEIQYLTKPESQNGSPKKVETYIGVSIRKDYDTKTLKGRGTLYVASDRGPHAYLNKGQLIDQAWQEPRLLQYAFMHELGHLFGIPHTGVGLMSETFLDMMLSQRMSPFYAKNPVQPFMSAPDDFEICSFSGHFHPKFFQLTEETACLLLKSEVSSPGVSPRWKVFAKKYADSTPVEIGGVQLDAPTVKANSAKPLVTLQLPEDQQVFSAAEKGFASFLVGGILQESDYQGAFHTASSLKPYPLFAALTPDSVTFVATVDGKQTPVLVYAPPSLLRMLIPIQPRPVFTEKAK